MTNSQIIIFKKLSIIVLLCNLINTIYAQDVIYFTDSTKVQALIKEVYPKVIKYKLFLQSNDSLYIIDKELVAKIIYKNGIQEIFKRETQITERQKFDDSHKKSKRRIIDTTKFNRKNILLYNFTEYIEGAYALNYYRVFYKPKLSASCALAYGKNNSYPALSDGILIEKNRDYALSHKNIDASIGINKNFFFDYRKSFVFVGLLFRMAQFEGYYGPHLFILNKYYTYLNVGFIGRFRCGISYSTNISVGRYYNDYVKNNPIDFMNKNYVRTENPPINSFNFAMTVGYSF